jgi:PIN domain nuclease of toxin-antitoxin system
MLGHGHCPATDGCPAKAVAQAASVFVAPITFFEIGQKVRLGKWPEMEPMVDRLAELLVSQGGQAAVLAPKTCLLAARLDWAHRDPFDRIIAATALVNHWPLISIDTTFDALADHTDWVARFW